MIGRRPYAAFGNSTGDRQMLEYTGAGDGARLVMLVLHDDAKREYAYGPADGLPDTKVGTFTQALYDEAKEEGLDRHQHEERLEADLRVRVERFSSSPDCSPPSRRRRAGGLAPARRRRLSDRLRSRPVHLLHRLVDGEARRLLARRELLERLQELASR